MNSKHIGVTIILLASVMWAIEPILAKLSYQNSDFIQTSALRAIFAALTALIYIGITNNANHRNFLTFCKNIVPIKKRGFKIIFQFSVFNS